MTEQNGLERSSATDKLRRLLDERGVEWWAEDDPEDPPYYFVTKWFSNASEQTFEEIPAIRSRSLTAFCITPEQAVAATLGPGTCRDVAEFRGFGTKTEFRCSECGYEYSAVGGFGCDYGDEPDFRYCPSCGARVIGA